MTSDPFSDILRLTEATSMIAGGFTAGGAWAVRFPPPGQIVFCAIAKGACWFRLDGEAPIRVEQGDVGLLSGREGYVLGSDLAVRPQELPLDDAGRLEAIGTGDDCVVLAGLIALHPSSLALLADVFPGFVYVRAADPRAATIRWLVEQLLEELTSARPGTRVAAINLAQLVFVQILRAHLASSTALPAGWLRAIGDERLSRAVRLIHDEPSRAWTLSELAKAAGMSRTRFALHFKQVASVSPHTYLVEWRMQLAQRTLREQATPISELARSLGYASESAFSSAFKRIVGSSPRDYRHRAQRPPTA